MMQRDVGRISSIDTCEWPVRLGIFYCNHLLLNMEIPNLVSAHITKNKALRGQGHILYNISKIVAKEVRKLKSLLDSTRWPRPTVQYTSSLLTPNHLIETLGFIVVFNED